MRSIDLVLQCKLVSFVHCVKPFPISLSSGGMTMTFQDYLKILAFKDGSDLYLSTGAPPSTKFSGALKALEKESLPPGPGTTSANGATAHHGSA